MEDGAILDLSGDFGKELSGYFNELSTPTAAYSTYMAERVLPSTLMGGTKAMRLAGTTYLPQEEAETTLGYSNRINRSFLLNVYKRTVKKLAGEVFSKPVVYRDEMDETLKEYLSDIDLEGNNINVLGFKHFGDAIAYGLSYILVDYPEVAIEEEGGVDFVRGKDGNREILSQKKEKEMGLRPYCNVISASNIIGGKFEKINGVKTLSSVRIKDTTTVPEGAFGKKTVQRIRVLRIGSYETYIENNNGYELQSNGKTGLSYIPLFGFMIGTEINDLYCDFPLMDLAWLNIEHWQSSSDQRNQLHYGAMLTFLGVLLDDIQEDKKVVIGCNQIVHTSAPEGDLRVVESSGKALESGSNNLREIEKQMNSFGLSLTENKVDRETATSRLLDSLESSSTLKNWALLYHDILNNVINCMADYMGLSKSKEDLVKVNSDLIPTYGDTSVQVLLDSFRENAIDKETLLIEYKRRGVLRDRANLEEIITKSDKEKKENLKTENLNTEVVSETKTEATVPLTKK